MHPVTLIARAALTLWQVITGPDFGRDPTTGEKLNLASAAAGFAIIATIIAAVLLLAS